MPLLEKEAADLASIKLADEVKRLEKELAVCHLQYKFHGVMDVLVMYTDLARKNAALVERHRQSTAELAQKVIHSIKSLSRNRVVVGHPDRSRKNRLNTARQV